MRYTESEIEDHKLRSELWELKASEFRERATLMWLTRIHGVQFQIRWKLCNTWQVDTTPTESFTKKEWAQLMERRKKEQVYRKDRTTKRYRRIK